MDSLAQSLKIYCAPHSTVVGHRGVVSYHPHARTFRNQVAHICRIGVPDEARLVGVISWLMWGVRIR